MIDYSIEIINSCYEFFVPNTKHSIRNIQRIGDFDLIFETFLHNPPMGIIKQVFNNIKIICNEKLII